MHLYFLCFVLAVTTVHTHGSHQIQMPEAGAFTVDEDAAELLERLRHNVSVLWTEFGQLRTVLTETLTHLRVHQAELEETVHRLEHKHDENVDSHGSFTDDHHHHHSGEAHSHGDDSHSHGDDSHSHGGDSHSHGGDSHSHGDDDHHHHSGEQHSHSGEQHSHGSEHSHSGESHSHGDGHHESWSRSHSHQLGSSHSGHEMQEHHQHGDSHENGNDLQQAQQGADAIVEPLVVATSSQQHYHHSHQYPHMASANNLQLINDSSFYRHHHHHQHSQYVQSRSQRNRTVVVPKYSEYNLYDFAVCNVLPNRAIPESQQQEIIGRVNLWQKKTGGPLNIHVRLQGFDMGDHHQHHDAQQSIQQEEDNEPPIGHKHGFHIHDSGDMSNGCQSTGPHYNPKSMNHGGPNALVRHVGDLGNIECDDHGTVNIVFNDEIASLKGPYSIVGRAIVIHSGPDDYGLGGNEESLRTGNAGTRLACCVIEKVEKLPIRSYKYIKAATPYEN